MSQNEARYTVRSLIVTAVVAAIGTVLVLEMSGRINHSENKDLSNYASKSSRRSWEKRFFILIPAHILVAKPFTFLVDSS